MKKKSKIPPRTPLTVFLHESHLLELAIHILDALNHVMTLVNRQVKK